MKIRLPQHAAAFVVLACLLGTVHEGRAQATCPSELGYQPTDATSWCQRSAAYWNKYPDNAKATCESRSEPQSPINLRPPAEAKAGLGRLVFNYGVREGIFQDKNLVMENNGHTVELLLNSQQYGAQDPPAPPERTITVSGKRYVLQNAHFHYPSEHLVDGERFPLELHIVHQAGTQRVVVAVLFKIGAANPALDALFNGMVSVGAEKAKVQVAYDAAKLVTVPPGDGTYMRYEGSLTTPDCATGVSWLVFRTPVEVSQDQINKFTTAITAPLGFPVNARQWRESTAEVSLWAPSNRPSISCVSKQADQFDCFIRGRDQAMWHYASTTKTWVNLGGALFNPPECVSWGSNRIDCFVRGGGQAMYRKTWDGSSWQDWVSHGGTIREQPRCISWGANRIDCFARVGTAMQTIWFDGAWHAWTPIAQGGELLSPPECVSREPFRLDCFARGRLLGADGKPTTAPTTIHSWFDGAAWRGWEDLGGDILEQPCCNPISGGGIIECLARRTDATQFAVRHWLWKGNLRYTPSFSSWTPWSAENTTAAPNPPSCYGSAQRTEYFLRGPDQAAYLEHQISATRRWGGPVVEQPSCVSTSSATLACFARGPSGTIWHRRLDVLGSWENIGGMIAD